MELKLGKKQVFEKTGKNRIKMYLALALPLAYIKGILYQATLHLAVFLIPFYERNEKKIAKFGFISSILFYYLIS